MTTTSSLKIIIVEKQGSLRELNIKNYKEEELFKKAGFKSANHFALHHKYEIDEHTRIYIYGKLTGIAGQENRYELPPPMDNTLFFGNCILIKYVDDMPVNMQMNEWNGIYAKLFGGFESLNEEDSGNDDDEDEQDLKNLKEIAHETKSRTIQFTKQGYAKDGFIVGDDDEDDNEKKTNITKEKHGKAKIDNNLPTFRSGDSIERNDHLYFQGSDELKEESYE